MNSGEIPLNNVNVCDVTVALVICDIHHSMTLWKIKTISLKATINSGEQFVVKAFLNVSTTFYSLKSF